MPAKAVLIQLVLEHHEMAYNQYDWGGTKRNGAGYGNPLYNPSGSAQNTSGTSNSTQQAYAQKLDPAAASWANTMGPASTNAGYKPDMGAGSYGGTKSQTALPQTNYAPQQYGAGTNQMLGPTGAGSVGQFANVYDYADAYRRPWEAGTQGGSAPPGNFSVLPNFDQNGRIVSIPQGVNYSVPIDGGAPAWNYQGYTQTAQPIPGFGDPGAGTPIGQYTGGMPPNPYVATPANPLGATPWLGVGSFRA
jgi:hypothetical protein